MRNVQLIVVGGFLGAGKTTLLFGAASRLAARGRRVGLITNDQAPSLVDTALLAGRGFAVGEVAGSCFCCNFPGLLAAAEKLGREVGADILIAEPVGSCTDLSATILQPLKDRFSDGFSLAPLSVLVDPARLEETLGLRPSRLHDAAVYIVRKQLEEADIIALNKIDAVSPERLAELLRVVEDRYPRMEVRALSALTGDGVDAWLDRVLAGGPAGKRIAQVDYDRYAEGEAALGWLNATVRVEARAERVDWRAFSEEILRTVAERLRERGAEIGHLKLALRAGDRISAANLTRLGEDPAVRGEIPGEAREAVLVLNARAVIDPEDLERIAREGIDRAASGRVAVRIEELASLRPARPRPTYRYAEAISPEAPEGSDP